ncbi:MAG: SMC-Scp complex subunit ScpB [Alphaproteobacteria bacterium RIFCSPHIGHO2_12_FULL_45_9]|nr:MAG: SMC-Scp complex subunit ScpB [Alphaproteobacteria bacterium RIFCSPHIGHO2_12_FULL_45_9]
MSQSIESEIPEDEVEGAEAEEVMDDAPADDVAVEPLPVVALDDPAEQKRLIEALLFASPEPIALKAIQSRLPATADVGFILTELQEEYSKRGVNLVRLEDAWAFRTAADVGPYLALTKKEEKKLSRAGLETLAVIAYHQPVTRAEVENIRGVATNKGTLDVLLEAGWIKPGRRRETPGRPVTWITTNAFLDEFGISLLTDLPGLQELKASGLLDTRPAIENIVGADLFANGDSALPEGEEKDEATGEFDQETDAVEEEVLEDVVLEATEEMDDEISEEHSEDETIEEKESA